MCIPASPHLLPTAKREQNIASIKHPVGTSSTGIWRKRLVSFSELRDAGPVFVPFGHDGAIYEQFYTGQGASCRDE